MNKLTSTLLYAGTASLLTLNGCVGFTFNSKTLALPDKKIAEKNSRINPINNSLLVVESVGHGLAATCSTTYHTAKKDGFVKGTLYAPLNIAEGLATTVLDTAINLGAWLPVEGYEAIFGKTWDKPYMPLTESMRNAASLRTKN